MNRFKKLQIDLQQLHEQYKDGLITEDEYVLKAIDLMENVTYDEVPLNVLRKMLDVLIEAKP